LVLDGLNLKIGGTSLGYTVAIPDRERERERERESDITRGARPLPRAEAPIVAGALNKGAEALIYLLLHKVTM